MLKLIYLVIWVYSLYNKFIAKDTHFFFFLQLFLFSYAYFIILDFISKLNFFFIILVIITYNSESILRRPSNWVIPHRLDPPVSGCLAKQIYLIALFIKIFLDVIKVMWNFSYQKLLFYVPVIMQNCRRWKGSSSERIIIGFYIKLYSIFWLTFCQFYTPIYEYIISNTTPKLLSFALSLPSFFILQFLSYMHGL